MSKSSRRSGRRVPPSGPPAGRPTPSSAGAPSPAGATGAADRSGPRPSTSPTGTPRVGRRERPRYARQSFFERFRSLIVGGVVVALVGLVGAFLFLGASQPAYACTTEWAPDPTPTPGAGSSPRLGYVQPDQGRLHGAESGQTFALCPPASGTHYNIQGRGPIRAGVYGPDDTSVAIPQGWLHNLEHGSLVVLYRCDDSTDACEETGQAAMRALYGSFPDSPICAIPPGTESPVFARFDEMAYPYAALVWGRVLPMESWDPDLILEFWQREGERTNPERAPGCPFPSDATPSPSPTASPTAEPSASPSGEPSPSAS